VAVLEALATGLPVASTNVGEVPLVVRNGISGQISGARTAVALADAICTALGQLPSMAGEPCERAIAPSGRRRCWVSFMITTAVRPTRSAANSREDVEDEHHHQARQGGHEAPRGHA